MADDPKTDVEVSPDDKKVMSEMEHLQHGREFYDQVGERKGGHSHSTRGEEAPAPDVVREPNADTAGTTEAERRAG